MATYGVTKEGFVVKPLSVIQSEATTELATIGDPITGDLLAPDFSSDNPEMAIINMPLQEIANAWEAMGKSFNNYDPAVAENQYLDDLVRINNIALKPETKTIVLITVSGISGTVVKKGSIIQDSAGNNQWTINHDITISGAGSSVGRATCTEFGAITASSLEINTIVTPITGWTSVTNNETLPEDIGKPQETDIQLRARQVDSTLGPGSGQSSAIYANVMNIPEVSYCRVLINDTDSTDSRGITPRSIGLLVRGGDETVIAEKAIARAGGGVSFTFGLPNTFTVSLTDNQGLPYTVNIARPVAIPVFIDVQLTIIDRDTFPAETYITDIQNAIMEYAKNGADAIGVSSGFNDFGFTVGEDVIRSRLFTPVNSVPGHTITGLFLNTTGVPVTETADITIAFNQVSTFDAANITVSVTNP